MRQSAPKREIPKFTRREFEARAERARKLMTAAKLDGLLLTSQPNMEYLSGFASQFPTSSPTRPWYFVFPRLGAPVAVIPTGGVDNWRRTSWVTDVRSWRSPNPENEGLDILADSILRIRRRYGRFGVEMGPETRIGMPVGDLLRVRRKSRPLQMVDGADVMRELRLVKSPAEIARMRRVCQSVCDAFDALPSYVTAGDSEKEIMRKVQVDIIARGVDKTPYMMTISDRGGVRNFLMGPTNRRIGKGDVLCVDAGCTYDGYFCDFNRNYAIGEPTDELKRAHELLYKATTAGIRAARPGATAEDVFLAQAKTLTGGVIEEGFDKMGRFGHGVGMVMTEPPSNRLGDRTVLKPGVTLTIEPGIMLRRGKLLVHEENLVVTEAGSRLLTRRAPKQIPVIPC